MSDKPNPADTTNLRYNNLTIEYSSLWGTYSIMNGAMSIIDTPDRNIAYKVYRARSGHDITEREFITLVKYR